MAQSLIQEVKDLIARGDLINAILLLPTEDEQHPDMKTAFLGAYNRLEILRKSGEFGNNQYIDVYFTINVRVINYVTSLSQT